MSATPIIPPRFRLEKTYPQRGPMQQYRLLDGCAFACFRCGQEKKSRLVTTFMGDWDRLLCNGCYGRLLAIYDIQKGTLEDDARAEALTEVLLALVPKADAERLTRLLLLRDSRAQRLTPKSLRLLASAEYVATQLASTTNLDWSAAVIGMCKAVEHETNERLLAPLQRDCQGIDLAVDCADGDLGRVARYLAGRMATPPELGATRHFLHTASNSVSRRESSPVLRALYSMTRAWPNADWLFVGAPESYRTLTVRFRNRAAHTDELGPEDYHACQSLVVGPRGILWLLLQATASRA